MSSGHGYWIQTNSAGFVSFNRWLISLPILSESFSGTLHAAKTVLHSETASWSSMITSRVCCRRFNPKCPASCRSVSISGGVLSYLMRRTCSLLKPLMIAKVRQYNGDGSAGMLLKELRKEARRNGIRIPAEVYPAVDAGREWRSSLRHYIDDKTLVH